MGRNSTIQISILADTNRAQRALASLGSEVAGLGKILAFPTVVPALAAVTAGVGELGTALGVAAGAGAVFGISAVGIVTNMVKQSKAITALDTKLSSLTKGTDEYRQTAKALRLAQKQYTDDFGPAASGLDKLKGAFAKFQDSTRGVTTDVLGKAFRLLADLLPKLVPVSNAAGRAIGGLLDDLRHFTAGKGFSDFLHTLKTSGSANITRFGHIIGNLISGLGSILKNFVGPGDKFTASIEKATARFKVWAKSPGVSKGVQDFLDFVHQNAPAITSTIGSLTDILPKLASALGSLGTTDLQVISEFLSLLASLPQGVFDVLVTGTLVIVALVKVIKIWTAAQLILDAALDANPISILILAIAALGVALVIAYKKSQTFRDVLNSVVGFVKDHWAPIFILLTGPIGLAVVLIVKNFGKIVAAIKVLGGWGKWLWNNVFQPVIKLIIGGFSKLLSFMALVLHSVGNLSVFGRKLFPWADTMADKLDTAAGAAQNLADKINKIPNSKSVAIVLNVVKGVVHTTGGRVPTDPNSPINPKTLIPSSKLTMSTTNVNITVAPTPLSTPYEQGEAINAALKEFYSVSPG